MTWLLGATAPAKKVHFSMNGSELRGFPIKARSGQSSILYANPLAPKSSILFLPLSCCFFSGPKRSQRLSVNLECFLLNIHSCQRHRGGNARLQKKYLISYMNTDTSLNRFYFCEHDYSESWYIQHQPLVCKNYHSSLKVTVEHCRQIITKNLKPYMQSCRGQTALAPWQVH